MTNNTDQLRALAELVGAAGLMLLEIDTCGHPVDPTYRATLHDAWTNGQAALASAPPSAPVGVGAVRGAWLAAITLANNICVQESDRENDRDGDAGWINGTAECAKRIREYAHPTDAELLEMLDEAGANAAKAALAQQPAAPSAPVGLPSEDRVVLMRLKDALPDVGLNGWIDGVRVIERILAQQPAAVDEAGAWAKQQPTCPGIYGIRGFNLCRPVSEQFEAVVVVREYGGELVCNLHESTSEDDLSSWAPICDLDPDFEWRAFAPGWEQQGGRDDG